MKLSIKARALLALSNLTSLLWWKDAGLRGLYSAVAIALPYLGAAQLIADVSWVDVVSAGVLGLVVSLATSLAGLPEVAGVDLPWWLAALERTVKTFFQGIAAGLVGAVFVTEVDWLFILQASALSAGISLLRLILATLPADPTRVVDAGTVEPGAVVSITGLPSADR